MTSRPVPSPDDLRARLLARLDDIRSTLDRTAGVMSLSDAQRGEYERLVAALEMLEQRIREVLNPGSRPSSETGMGEEK